MADALSTREFDTWAKGHDARIERILNHMDEQVTLNRENERRMTALETNQQAAGKLSAKLSTIAGAIVAAIISGVFQLIGGKH